MNNTKSTTREQMLLNVVVFMGSKNIDPFWRSVVRHHLNAAMAGNNHFVTSVKNPKMSINRKFKKSLSVRSLTMDCTIQTETGNIAGMLTYREPTKRHGHRVDIKSI